jgi:hypothetical protein
MTIFPVPNYILPEDAEVGERAKAENQIEALRQTIMQKDEILKAYETNLRATLHGDHEN